jgi:hypothetical protein
MNNLHFINNKYVFKDETFNEHINLVSYHLIGTNIRITHNVLDEVVSVDDEELDGDEYSLAYHEKEFIETYGGYNCSEENITIEDLARAEWATIVNYNSSDRSISSKELEEFDKPATLKEFNYNFN